MMEIINVFIDAGFVRGPKTTENGEMNMYEYENEVGVNMLSIFVIIARRDGNEVFEPQFDAISNPRSSVFVHLF